MEEPEVKDNPNEESAESVEKIKTKGAASKFFNAFPEALNGIQDDIGGKQDRLKMLQERQKFLDTQFSSLMKEYEFNKQMVADGQMNALPPSIIDRFTQLSAERNKNQQEYIDEFNNVKKVTPPTDSNSINISHNGKDISVNADLVDAVKSGKPEVISRIMEMQDSEDPNVRDQVAALGQFMGEDQVMFRDNGEVSVDRVPPTVNPQTPNASAPNVAPPAIQQSSDLYSNAKQGAAQAGLTGGASSAVESIRRSLLSNLQKGKQ